MITRRQLLAEREAIAGMLRHRDRPMPVERHAPPPPALRRRGPARRDVAVVIAMPLFHLIVLGALFAPRALPMLVASAIATGVLLAASVSFARGRREARHDELPRATVIRHSRPHSL